MNRDEYLETIVARMHNGLIKVITGIRRCGKSYLVFTLFNNYLLASGVNADHIISLALDNDDFAGLRNPLRLGEYLRQHITNTKEQYYVLIDEIQYCYRLKRDDTDENLVAPEDRESLYINFYDVLNGISRLGNADIYVTGSNSRMLSDEIKTIFRGRGDAIQVHPFSFAEYRSFSGGDKNDDWEDYMTYGGMPLAVFDRNERSRRAYLSGLFEEVYVKDIVEHNRIQNVNLLEHLLNVLSSSVGSVTNPTKLVHSLRSSTGIQTTDITLALYIKYLIQAYLFIRVQRYDVKGKKYFETPYKLYSEDVGLRNARLNWRQQERPHLMENILFNELVRRGYAVDVGVVYIDSRKNGKRELRQHEIDFVINQGFQKTYIQSAFVIETQKKNEQKLLPLKHCRDFFRKIVVTGGNEKLWIDEDGIMHIGIIPFLLDRKLLD